MMDLFALLMFLAVGIGAAHIAVKTGEGEMPWNTALAIAVPAAIFGGIGSRLAGMSFYVVAGQMVVGLGCAAFCILLWRQLKL